MRASGPSRCPTSSSTASLTIWLTTPRVSRASCSPSTAGRSPDPWGHLWRPIAREVGLPTGTGLHSLRHYYASLLIRHGESIKTVQARLGHATAAETLDTYSHLWPDSDDRTREAIDSVLGNDGDENSCGLSADRSTPHQTFPQVRGGDADGLACRPGSVRGPLAGPGRRPSIYGCRCRHPPAVYPRARAGHPQSHARPVPGGTRLLDLAPGGVCLAGPVARVAGGLLHHRFTLAAAPGGAVAVCSLWHCPAGHPGWVLPTTLPCGARTFLGVVLPVA
jgi:hypothetical protein